MNAAVRAIVRMGIYIGCRVFLIKEVCSSYCHSHISAMFVLPAVCPRGVKRGHWKVKQDNGARSQEGTGQEGCRMRLGIPRHGTGGM